MRHLFTLIALAFLSSTSLMAIIEHVPLDQRVDQADLIIEGQVISTHSHWDMDKKLIYTVNELRIYKLFKGTIVNSIIEVYTEGGIVGDRKLEVDPSLRLQVGDAGIFFLYGSPVVFDNTWNTSAPGYEPYASVQGFIKYNEAQLKATDPFNEYHNIKTDLYGFIEHQLNRKPQELQPFNAQNFISAPATRAVPPVISSFSPTTITAGTWSVLTINGSNFGASFSGSAMVWFRNCNDGGSTYVSVPSSHIRSWSDTQIEVWVSDGAGTGTFQVTNVGNESTATTDTLTVTYNVTMLSNDSIADFVNDSLGGYYFSYNTQFDDSVAAKAAFERAIESWRCATYANLNISTSTTAVACQASDGVNMVSFDYSCGLSAGVLGTAYSFYQAFGCGAWYIVEIDIKFDSWPSAGWYYGVNAGGIAGQSDFESVALHEVGHNHQLGHVINNGAVMHYSITSGTTSRILNPAGDIAAGNFIMNRSVVSNGCGPTRMDSLTAGNCSFSGACTMTTTISGTDPSCAAGTDGTATVTPSGGTAPITYSWNSSPVQLTPTATALPAGTYICTVTDSAGCVVMDTVTLTDPATLSVSFTPSDASCNMGSDGSIQANPSGGTPGYSYSWNTSPVQMTQTATALSAGTYTVTVTDTMGCTVVDSGVIGQPTAISLSFTQKDLLCNGDSSGSAVVTASGGTSGSGLYNYLWNTVPAVNDSFIQAMPAGTYTVTVTDDNSCTAIDSVQLNEPAAIVTSINSVVHVDCWGDSTGSANVHSSGGTGTHMYFWNTTPPQMDSTATGLPAGKHVVTVVDALGCPKADSVTLTQNTLLKNFLTKGDATSCTSSDGWATSSPSGGVGPYTFSWSTSPVQDSSTAIGLDGGGYTVTVTDTLGCSRTDSVTINEPNTISLSIIPTPVTCNGDMDGTATVTPSGGTGPYSYVWNTSPVQNDSTATGLGAGSYTVTVTDALGCTKEGTVSISDPAPLVLSVSSRPATPGNSDGDATVHASGGVPTYTYAWNTTPAQTDSIAVGLAAGTYMVTVTDLLGCSDTISVTVGEVSGIAIGGNDGRIKLYPNPATDAMTIEWLMPMTSEVSYQVWNVLGIQVAQGTLTDKATRIALDGLQDGHYYVRFVSDSNMYVMQFTKSR